MDIRSKDILKQALKSFDGTLIVVSHDRDFLDGLVDKLYEFREGRVMEHLGSVQDFLQKRKLETLQELERRFPGTEEKLASEEKSRQAKNYQQQKSLNKEQRKLQNCISFLEKEIARVENRMGEIEKMLAQPGEKDDVMELTREYLEFKRALDAHTEEWTSLMEQLEN